MLRERSSVWVLAAVSMASLASAQDVPRGGDPPAAPVDTAQDGTRQRGTEEPGAGAAGAQAAGDDADPIVQDLPPEPTDALIEERIVELSRLPEIEDHASAALDHARLALARSRDLARAGDEAAADRARQIAWAALSLASRRVDVVRERQALRAAALRLRRARARARRSRAALEHAIEQHGEVRAPEREERTVPTPAPADDEGEME